MTKRRPTLTIGQEFTYPETGERWRVTDIGTRTFLAINLSRQTTVSMNRDGSNRTEVTGPPPPDDLKGPPYSVEECVWDEYDVEALTDVPELWLNPVPRSPLEILVDKARLLAVKWRSDGAGVDAGALVDLVYAVEGLNAAQLDHPSFQVWNARYMGEPVLCPACGADYAEAEAKNQRLAWRGGDGQAVPPFTPGAVAFPHREARYEVWARAKGWTRPGEAPGPVAPLEAGEWEREMSQRLGHVERPTPAEPMPAVRVEDAAPVCPTVSLTGLPYRSDCGHAVDDPCKWCIADRSAHSIPAESRSPAEIDRTSEWDMGDDRP